MMRSVSVLWQLLLLATVVKSKWRRGQDGCLFAQMLQCKCIKKTTDTDTNHLCACPPPNNLNAFLVSIPSKLIKAKNNQAKNRPSRRIP
jgi:hypothetical protein